MRPPRLATYVTVLTSVQRLLKKIYEVLKRLSHEMDLTFDGESIHYPLLSMHNYTPLMIIAGMIKISS